MLGDGNWCGRDEGQITSVGMCQAISLLADVSTRDWRSFHPTKDGKSNIFGEHGADFNSGCRYAPMVELPQFAEDTIFIGDPIIADYSPFMIPKVSLSVSHGNVSVPHYNDTITIQDFRFENVDSSENVRVETVERQAYYWCLHQAPECDIYQFESQPHKVFAQQFSALLRHHGFPQCEL